MTADGTIAVFQGIPGTIAGFDLSTVDYLSNTKLDDLTPVAQDKVKEGIPAGEPAGGPRSSWTTCSTRRQERAAVLPDAGRRRTAPPPTRRRPDGGTADVPGRPTPTRPTTGHRRPAADCRPGGPLTPSPAAAAAADRPTEPHNHVRTPP